MLKPIDIAIDDLVLDPNNPRFASDFALPKKIPDDQLVQAGHKVLERYSLGGVDEDESSTSTEDLRDSMLRIGYVAIDRVVVRQIKNTDKYLVIEGNRRISTVKNLLMELEKKDWSDQQLANIEEHAASFRMIPCMLIDEVGKSESEVNHMVSLILGIRHHGSLLEWEPLPRAYNIYNEYMGLFHDPNQPFKRDHSKIDEIASRLSISKMKVRSALETYIAYLQLSNAIPGVKSRHFSLIEAAISSGPMRSHYINQDPNTYEIDDDSIEKLDALLQFGDRDRPDFSEKRVVNDPKAVGKFASLIKRRAEADHEASKDFIQAQIDAVISTDSETTLDRAVDVVTDYLNRTKWVDALDRLLGDQEAKLLVEDFESSGNDLAYLNLVSRFAKKINALVD